ncbi:FtsX-like permease family protein [Ulvibacterium sp.]|uniref:ABC transporter permease n=1 Tax=Ulvibacterium sp. TaxID=2665914 RepID=UPI00261BD5AE|nr:FtsX-like permease family protein [Ulvibacterium sp.]
MKLSYLAYRNMVSKPLNLLLSLLLLLLSVSLVTFVIQVSKQLDGQLSKNIAPFDMVVGAKGSPLQLVLSSVLHIDVPTGNIKLKEVAAIQRHPFIQTTIPVSYGDNYKGYRILGTETGYLDLYNAQLMEGKLYEKSFEVVAGSTVAQKLGLKVGDNFVSSHGLASSGGEAHDDHPFVITGILKSTGTVVDQLLISNLESIWEVHDHGEDGHQEGEGGTLEEQEEEKEITSLLVKFKSPLGMVQLPRFINENTSMQAALPGFEVQRLMGLLGSGAQTVNGIAFVILLVSGLSIFISLLKTIRERRQELALLRIYGLRTGQLLWLALLEGLLLAAIGFLSGWFVGRLGIWAVSRYTQDSYGYGLQVTGPDKMEFLLLGLTLGIALMAALLASRSIFKLNVAKTLSDA